MPKNEVVLAPAATGPDRDLLNRVLGQAQMASAFESFSRTVTVSKLALVKESKLYQQLKGMRAPNGSEFRGTWDEFCGLLKMSVDKADLDITNFKAFGEEALDQMQRVGIGYRELRDFRRLPDDERAALAEIAKTGDKDQILELAETLVAKHAKEKAELQADVEELQRGQTDLAVQRDKAEADAKAAEKKLARRNRDQEDANVPLAIADLRAELAALVKKAELALTSLHPVGVDIVNQTGYMDEWVAPTLRLGVAGLMSLRVLVDGALKSYTEAMGEKVKSLGSGPDTLAFLDESEIKAVAEDWARLVAVHQHEAALREHERAAARPKGKGRPSKAPEAPAAVAGKASKA